MTEGSLPLQQQWCPGDRPAGWVDRL